MLPLVAICLRGFVVGVGCGNVVGVAVGKTRLPVGTHCIIGMFAREPTKPGHYFGTKLSLSVSCVRPFVCTK